jgi:uncharacterized membrane protein YfcA
MTPHDVVLLAVAGFLAGVCNAVAGGGTLLTFPALMATGLPPVAANVTNTVAVWPGYLGGTSAFRDKLRGSRSFLTRLLVVALAGGTAGTILLLALPGKVFGTLAPYLVLGATAIFAVQPLLSRLLTRLTGGSAAGAPLLGGIFLAAVYGAYFGGGLGIILLAVLMLCVTAEAQYLNGVKALLSLAVNTVALLAFVVFGQVHWAAVLIVGPLCLIGGTVGGRLAKRLPPLALRVVVTVFGLVIGVHMLL